MPVSPLQTTETEISSPCIGVCTLHSDGFCIGCFRSSDEITRWCNLSQGQRLCLMAELPRRAQNWFDGFQGDS